uniref:Uncharacterized protein n=1 Tax=Parastrongyloides trichosuri TaxID=131310 RepID=A0A0N4Z6U5_PARTI
MEEFFDPINLEIVLDEEEYGSKTNKEFYPNFLKEYITLVRNEQFVDPLYFTTNEEKNITTIRLNDDVDRVIIPSTSIENFDNSL